MLRIVYKHSRLSKWFILCLRARDAFTWSSIWLIRHHVPVKAALQYKRTKTTNKRKKKPSIYFVFFFPKVFTTSWNLGEGDSTLQVAFDVSPTSSSIKFQAFPKSTKNHRPSSALVPLPLLSSAVSGNQGKHSSVDGWTHWEGHVYGAQEGLINWEGTGYCWLELNYNSYEYILLMVLIIYFIPSFEAFKNSMWACHKTMIHEDTDRAILTQRKRITFCPSNEYHCLPFRQIPRSWVNQNVARLSEQIASGLVISQE